jgi:hypothetical protein
MVCARGLFPKEVAVETQEEAKRHADRVSGVSNIAYDLMVVLTNKLEGIAALEEYMLDAEEAGDREVRALFARLERRMREDVDELRDVLVGRLQQGSGFAGELRELATDEVVG